MTTVLVLGTTGMLGSMVYDQLRRIDGLTVRAAARSAGDPGTATIDAELDTPDLAAIDWVVNCIGIIKPYIHDDNRAEVRRAIQVNSLFPMRLAEAAERTAARVIQIATDCVYSGKEGMYGERAAHDATDAYGKTKSLGEVSSDRMIHLRCSIIGPERHGFVSLLEWFRKQGAGAKLNGYRNHKWNGVTTMHFAKLCAAILKGFDIPAGPHHIVPTGDITKANLLRSFAKHFKRGDVVITDVDAPVVIDRRLSTETPEVSAALWRAAGYEQPPTVDQMVAELAEVASE